MIEWRKKHFEDYNKKMTDLDKPRNRFFSSDNITREEDTLIKRDTKKMKDNQNLNNIINTSNENSTETEKDAAKEFADSVDIDNIARKGEHCYEY